MKMQFYMHRRQILAQAIHKHLPKNNSIQWTELNYHFSAGAWTRSCPYNLVNASHAQGIWPSASTLSPQVVEILLAHRNKKLNMWEYLLTLDGIYKDKHRETDHARHCSTLQVGQKCLTASRAVKRVRILVQIIRCGFKS